MTKTRVGIFGYGNLGRGVELACRQNDDMELVALFTRREMCIRDSSSGEISRICSTMSR